MSELSWEGKGGHQDAAHRARDQQNPKFGPSYLGRGSARCHN